MKNITKIIAVLSCMAVLATSAFAQSRKQQAEDAIQDNLPSGVSIEDASLEELMSAAEEAMQEDDSLAAEITDTVVTQFPAEAADIASALASVSPNNAGVITTSAATASQRSGNRNAPNIQTISNRVKSAVPQSAAVVDNAVSNYSPPVTVPDVAIEAVEEAGAEPPPDIVNPPSPSPDNSN